MITQQVLEYWNEPIFFSYQAQRTPVQDIPFPAVTICSQSQMIPSIFNYSALKLKLKYQLTLKEQHQLDFANHICHLDRSAPQSHKLLNVTVLEDMFQLRNDLCAEEFPRIEWQRVNLVPPCRFLQSTLTPLGHCYTFNMVPFSRLYNPPFSRMFSSPRSSLLNASNKREPDEEYWSSQQNNTPWNIRDTTVSGGVALSLNFRSHDFDNTCNLGEKSFVVMVHSPSETADDDHDLFVVEANSIGLVTISPQVNLPSPGLEALPPSRRGCFLPGEKSLLFFSMYNQKNCQVECIANLTLRECGCVLFFHPREKTTPVCGLDLLACILKINSRQTDVECDCLPSCSHIQYSATLTTLNRKKNSNDSHDLAYLVLSITKKGVTAKVAENITASSEVIGNLGGLLSLFLGGSVISLLEIFYFSSLRPLVVIWNQCKGTRSGHELQ